MAGRVLRVFFDLDHEWPLWESGVGRYEREPADYGFSEEVVALLVRWREAWARIPIPGSDPDDDRQASEQDLAAVRSLRRQAIAVMRREVPPDVEVRDG